MDWKFIKPRKIPLEQSLVVVSGVPRSGTSMMMRMLAAGGLEILTDGVRSPDESNLKGYFEFERVKKLPEGDTAWVKDARGKVVKVISYLLEYLPEEVSYKVIFMRRELSEVLSSQRHMLSREGKPEGEASDEQMAELYSKHLAQVETWMKQQPGLDVLEVNYNRAVQEPGEVVDQVNRFLGGDLDTAAMAAVIDLALYRERK